MMTNEGSSKIVKRFFDIARPYNSYTVAPVLSGHLWENGNLATVCPWFQVSTWRLSSDHDIFDTAAFTYLES